MPELVLLGLLLRTQSARAVPVNPAQDALGVVDDDEVVDPLGIDDVPDVDDCASAPVAASDVARMSVFNFHNFIKPPKTSRTTQRTLSSVFAPKPQDLPRP
jgi:hypothetical protein